MITGLTVRENQGQNAGKFRYLTGISHTLNGVAGFSSLTLEAHISRAIPAAFLCQYGSPYNGRAVREGAIPAGPLAGLLTRTVPLTRLAAGKRSNRPQLEDSIMAINATPTGAIRPNHTTSEITWVKESTAIKRLRRHLAKSGCSLHISREGSAERQRHGEYYIRDEDGRLVDDKISLESWLRAYGLLVDDERIEPPPEKGWRYFVARYRIVQVDGVNARYAEPISREFTSRSAANRAAQGISDRDDLVLVAYDANRRDGAI